MLLHNPMHHRQPQARAFTHLFRREKWFEDAWQILGRNARARVAHTHNNMLTGLRFRMGLRVSFIHNDPLGCNGEPVRPWAWRRGR